MCKCVCACVCEKYRGRVEGNSYGENSERIKREGGSGEWIREGLV